MVSGYRSAVTAGIDGLFAVAGESATLTKGLDTYSITLVPAERDGEALIDGGQAFDYRRQHFLVLRASLTVEVEAGDQIQWAGGTYKVDNFLAVDEADPMQVMWRISTVKVA